MVKKANLLKILVLSFIGGICLAKVGFPLRISLIMAVGLGCFMLVAIKGRNNKMLIYLVILFILFGQGRYEIQPKEIIWDFSKENKMACLIEGVIKQVKKKRNFMNIIMNSSRVIIGEVKWEIRQKWIIYLPRYPELSAGDKVLVTGKLKEVLPKDRRVLDLNGISGIILGDSFKVLKPAKMFSGRVIMDKFRILLEERMQKIFPEPAASLQLGLLLGETGGFLPEILDNFSSAGLTHVLAVSGYNVALIILFCGALFGFMNRRKRIYVIVGIMIVFMLLTGMSASIVRATIMGFLALLAMQTGRAGDAKNALFVAVFLMLTVNPKVLFMDVSFQLSAGATLGIIYCSPFLSKVLEKWPSILGIKESLIITFAAQVFTTPIVYFTFRRIAWIAPLANLIIIPCIPVLMLFGFISLLVSIISLTLAQIIAYPAWLIMMFLFKFVEMLS